MRYQQVPVRDALTMPIFREEAYRGPVQQQPRVHHDVPIGSSTLTRQDVARISVEPSSQESLALDLGTLTSD